MLSKVRYMLEKYRFVFKHNLENRWEMLLFDEEYVTWTTVCLPYNQLNFTLKKSRFVKECPPFSYCLKKTFFFSVFLDKNIFQQNPIFSSLFLLNLAFDTLSETSPLYCWNLLPPSGGFPPPSGTNHGPTHVGR